MAEQPSPPPNQRPSPAAGGLTLRVAWLSDVGRARDHQEDNTCVVEPTDPAMLQRKGRLYLVADGMGGHNAGEVASQIAVTEIQRAYYADPSPDIPTALTNALAAANRAIAQRAQATAAQSGMGTTATLAVVREREVVIGNVGDSRTYLLRNGALSQVTHDHSLVDEQVRAGVLTAEQARNHPQRNVITQALGKTEHVQPDFFNGVLQAGDTLVLCSDGLSTMLTDGEIQEIVSKLAPADAARRLVDQANERGGLDNISVILVRAETPGGSRQAMPAVARASGSQAAVPARAPGSAAKAASRFPLWLIVAAAAIAVVALLGIALLLRVPGSGNGEPTATVRGPRSSATATLRAPAPTATVLAAGPVSPLPTATLMASNGTSLTTTATLAPSATDTVAPPVAGPTPMNQPPPVLLKPDGNITVAGDDQQRFAWDWSGKLQPGQGFQVLIWKVSNAASAADQVVTAKSNDSWEQTIRLSQAPAVKLGGDGIYEWTVALIQRDPYRQLAPTPTPRRLIYQAQKAGPRPTRTSILPPTRTPLVTLPPIFRSTATPIRR